MDFSKLLVARRSRRAVVSSTACLAASSLGGNTESNSLQMLVRERLRKDDAGHSIILDAAVRRSPVSAADLERRRSVLIGCQAVCARFGHYVQGCRFSRRQTHPTR
jgi:hypothetical protein